jgi:hypothetical protein
MFHKFQVSHMTHQYFFLERTWLVYIQDGYGLSIQFVDNKRKQKLKKINRCVHAIPYYRNVNTIGDSMVLHGHIEINEKYV